MTDTALDTLPDDKSERSLGERARDAASTAKDKVSTAASTASEKTASAASTAKEKVSSAASATIEAAKEHPLAAAGIAAGVAAAVGGAAYAATKLSEKPTPRKRKPAAPRKAPAKK